MIGNTSARIMILACLLNLGMAAAQAQDSCTPDGERQETSGSKPANINKDDFAARLPRVSTSRPNPEGEAQAKALNEDVAVFMRPAEEMYKTGNLAGAEKACLQAISIREKYDRQYNSKSIDTFGRKFLGEIYLKSGQNTKALECFRLVYPHGPDDNLKLNITLAYCRMGNYEQAMRFYTDGIMGTYSYGGRLLDPGNFPNTDNLTDLHARVLLARGVEAYVRTDAEEAVVDLQEADKLLPKNPAVQFFWGEALKRLERFAEAIPHYDIAAARGSGVIGKEAKEGVRRSRIALETRKAWEEQQAKKAKKTPQSAAQDSGKTGP